MPKGFGRKPRGMPFLGRKRPFLALVGVGLAIFPALGSSGQNSRASGKRYSGGRDFIGLRRQTPPLLDLGTRLSPLMQLVPVSGDGDYQDYLAGSFLASAALIHSMPPGLKSSLIQKRIRANENRLAAYSCERP